MTTTTLTREAAAAGLVTDANEFFENLSFSELAPSERAEFPRWSTQELEADWQRLLRGENP